MGRKNLCDQGFLLCSGANITCTTTKFHTTGSKDKNGDLHAKFLHMSF